MIITISGTSGSGKSTAAKLLQKALGAERIYVGGIRREIARQKGMSLPELNEYAKNNPETDVDVDRAAAAQAREFAAAGRIVIAEGYTQYHFLPESVKVLIHASLDVGAERIWKDLQDESAAQSRNEGEFSSLEAMKLRVAERVSEDSARYQKYYGINHLDESQYDLVIDSSTLSKEEVVQKIVDHIESQDHSQRL